MRIVVIGYGRVGSRVIRALACRDHILTLIDKDAVRLQSAVGLTNVKLVAGDAIELSVQREAGVGEADVLLALTRDDNVNLLAVHVAREFFRVPQAIARVYEPSHAEVCADAQITTICPTLYAVDAIVTRIEPSLSTVPSASAPVSQHIAGSRHGEQRDARFVLIVGGGKVGINLARSLHNSGHEVVLIEKDWARARHLEVSLETPVIQGDGSTVPVLEAGGAARARVLVAVTDSDPDNWVSCQLAKRIFGVQKTIARVTNPKNEEVFQRLGVDTTISSTGIIEQVIERELPTIRIRTLLQMQDGATQLIEYALVEGSPAIGRRLRDIGFPPDCNLVAVLRQGVTIVPRGDTQLEIGDLVIALVRAEREEDFRQLLVGP